MTKIPEKEIYEMFVDCNITDITPSHILMCYYILIYNSTCLDRKLNNLINSADPRKRTRALKKKIGEIMKLDLSLFHNFYYHLVYSYDLTELIPIRMILLTTERRGKGHDYKYLYPELLALISNNYPEIFDIDSLLTYEDWELKNKVPDDYLVELLLTVMSGLDDDSGEPGILFFTRRRKKK